MENERRMESHGEIRESLNDELTALRAENARLIAALEKANRLLDLMVNFRECDHLHHPAKMRHTYDVDCPVEAEVETLVTTIRHAIGKEPK